MRITVPNPVSFSEEEDILTIVCDSFSVEDEASEPTYGPNHVVNGEMDGDDPWSLYTGTTIGDSRMSFDPEQDCSAFQEAINDPQPGLHRVTWDRGAGTAPMSLVFWDADPLALYDGTGNTATITVHGAVGSPNIVLDADHVGGWLSNLKIEAILSA